MKILIAEHSDATLEKPAIATRKAIRTWAELREVLNNLLPDNALVYEVNIHGLDPAITVYQATNPTAVSVQSSMPTVYKGGD